MRNGDKVKGYIGEQFDPNKNENMTPGAVPVYYTGIVKQIREDQAFIQRDDERTGSGPNGWWRIKRKIDGAWGGNNGFGALQVVR